MKQSIEKIYNKLVKVPMAVVVVPFAMGIFFAEKVDVPLWVLLLLAATTLLFTLLCRRLQQTISAMALLAVVGAMLHTLSFDMEPHYGNPYDMELEVERGSVLREDYTSTEMRITDCSFSPLVGKQVVVWGGPEHTFSMGDRLYITAPIRAFREERGNYAEQMFHKGFVGTLSLYSTSLYEFRPAERRSLHERVVERLRSLINESDERSIILAMTVGYRDEISSTLREQYSVAGASHILAVSGLHVGMVFMLINLLLYLLLSLPYGNVIRSVLAITLIWLYVVVCGASPTAIRAAIMFSILQLSISSLREYISLNSLCATALLMLAFDTHLLFNLSFQLSVVAVSGILCWALPLCEMLKRGVKVVDMLLVTLFIGLFATLATAPLIAHHFGVISFVGIVINPLVLITANILIFTTLLILVAPFDFMIEIVKGCAEVQNAVIAWGAEVYGGHLSVSLSEGVVWAIYASFILITLFLCTKKLKKRGKIEFN